MLRCAAALALVALGVAACGGGDGSGTPTATPRTDGGSASPDPDRAAGAGRDPTEVASGIPFPSNLAFDARGDLWVTSGAVAKQSSDGVWFVPPGGGQARHVAKGLATAFGLTWVGDQLYVSHSTSQRNGRVTVLEEFTGTKFKRRRTAIDHIRVGWHPIGSILQGPDERMYVRSGAPIENGEPAGRVLSFRPGGDRAVVEAVGLSGNVGLAFAGRRLLVTDVGRNDLGPSRPRDELNVFDPAGPVVDFGFPGCYGQGGRACEDKVEPLVSLPPHSTPTEIAVVGDVAYVAQNGSALEENPTDSAVVRVDLRTRRQRIFWRSPVGHDPLGVAIGPDGDLYVTLYVSGKVVRLDL